MGAGALARDAWIRASSTRSSSPAPRTKLEIVAADERDSGRRAVLNLGHTVGHAIEAASAYARYRHGEAVGLGLLAALRALRRAATCAMRSRRPSSATGCRLALDAGDRCRRRARGDRPRQEAHRGRARLRALSAPGRGADGPGGRARGCAPPSSGSTAERSSRSRIVWRSMASSAHNRVEVLHGVNLDALGRRDPEQYGDADACTSSRRRSSASAASSTSSSRSFRPTARASSSSGCTGCPRSPTPRCSTPAPGPTTAGRSATRSRSPALPAVEVHLSDVDAREEWRRHSVLEGLVIGKVAGKGAGWLPRGTRAAEAGAQRVSAERAERLAARWPGRGSIS